MQNKIIYVQWLNDFGGLERITYQYENIFKNLNPKVASLRFKENGLKYNNYYRFKNKDRLFFIFEYFSFVKKRKDSIFHIQYTGSFILFLTYLAGSRKLVYHFHGTKFSANFFDKIIWKLLSEKVRVIANSNHTNKVICEKLKLKKNIFIIPNLINISNFAFKKRVYNSGKFIVTYAGRFTKGKNIELLLDAATRIKDCGKDDDFEFRLFGDGPNKENVINKASNLNLKDIVKILPFENEINSVYQESHLFVFLSLYESFGNVVAEAIFTGLPIICYRIPSLEEFINDDTLFLEKLDAKVLADKILEFKSNYSAITMKMETVYKYTTNYLDNKKIISQLEKIYNEL